MRRLPAAVLLLALSAACGNDAESVADTGSDTTTDAPTTTEEPAPTTTEEAAPTTTTTEPAPLPVHAVGLVPVYGPLSDFAGQVVNNATLVWTVYSGSGGVIVENIGGQLPPGCHGTSFFDPATFELLEISDEDLHAYATVGEGGCDNMQQDLEEGVVDGAAVVVNTDDFIQFDFGNLPPLPFDASTQVINPDGDSGVFRFGNRDKPLFINDLTDATHAVGVSGLFGIDPETGVLTRVDQPATEPGAGCDEFLLCLNDRFQIEITNEEGSPGSVLASDGLGGMFFFLGPEQWDAYVGVVNGCELNNSFWVFAAASTQVEFDLTVIDTATGDSRTFINPLEDLPEPILDTSAFATCP